MVRGHAPSRAFVPADADRAFASQRSNFPSLNLVREGKFEFVLSEHEPRQFDAIKYILNGRSRFIGVFVECAVYLQLLEVMRQRLRYM